MSNKYFFRGRISDEKFRLILKLFCLYEAKVAKLTTNRGTINNIYQKNSGANCRNLEAESLEKW